MDGYPEPRGESRGRRTLLSSKLALRLEQLIELWAPMGEDGERHPEHGCITREQMLELLDAPVDAVEHP